ncbi:hypothetical protein RR46_15139 [Papilio xuthus]|uniref:Uncharacterized protein n=1 Tax=Papilio xuthus TaxID=66420 RepID=A0A194PKL2_PAPXU|nr:hypothetical protein RR46_15139 [Papilio xuthus]
MTLYVIVYLLFINIVTAKINGGPRGRFDDNHARPHGYVSTHHPHYTYHPPNHIYFMCKQCSSLVAYPVYHGTPPTYVYKYREYGGRYGDLLSGLALYNLGRASNEQWHYTLYERRPDEKCSLQIVDQNLFEETTFPCLMMSSFVDSSNNFLKNPHPLDITTAQINVRALVHNNGTVIKVTKDQECVIWHNSTIKNEHVMIPCALLKNYADTMRPHGLPVYVWLPLTLATVIGIYIFCQSCFTQKKSHIDETPCNPTLTTSYFSNNNTVTIH